ncbi:hypothetical protein [Pyrobaculum ferrireducens]|uniref:hypothetical protein n=1 Tax=Pyrobaculum ferrireducens TaxID=1104324 RepID=UPI0018731CB2|nr:hypothetical protein [Pyrobaculum ferrireducens]
MDAWYRLRYLWASLVFRNKPVIRRVKPVEELIDEVVRHCPRPYRMMCFTAARELNLSLPAIASSGRDVPTAVALALEDVTSGDAELPRLWRYIKTGDPGTDPAELLKKWRKAFKP